MLGYPHLWKPTRHWEAPLWRKCASLYRRSAQVLQVRWRFRMAKAMPCHAAMVKLYMEDGVRSSLHSWDVRNIDGLVYHGLPMFRHWHMWTPKRYPSPVILVGKCICPSSTAGGSAHVKGVITQL